ncbi:Lipopolysaccharide-modifying protein [Moelleriella libera RCEF 2490]|uniref:Lipopolysaccharide-modifying protein n=1 Tax=Moelleriella libera RCEF 2490 TaxID=1081109 RepID=A0A166NS49_9HYPO|nr:Lipopolysaccharide-modifying protein [Moelleriella libera RCEF 2490]
MLRPWRVPRLLVRRLRSHAIACIAILLLVGNVALWFDTQFWDPRNLRSPVGARPHPIRTLMARARLKHNTLLSKRSHNVEAAAARYRERRGRHPPPGFDQWFAAAQKSKAIIVEDFFDRIYKDLAPFWSLDLETLRTRAAAWHHVVSVRNGKVTGKGDVTNLVNWLELWTDLVKEFAQYLPDVDMPINYMDEPRIVVPFGEMSKLQNREIRNRSMPEPSRAISHFQGLHDVDQKNATPYDPIWHRIEENHWNLVVKGCDPSSPAYGVEQASDLTEPAHFPRNYRPSYAYEGYIWDWAAARDPCQQPHIRQLHGTFIEPVSQSVTHELIPLFGGSKLPMNNEILIPGAMYLTKREFYSGGDKNHGPSWERKTTGLMWRGDGSGGRTKENTWHHFQRHRLVDMLNSTLVSRLEANASQRAMTFELPSQTIYPSKTIRMKRLGPWLKSFADARFVHLCPPKECDFFGRFFETTKEVPMKKQYRYKFLPDVDGNSFSARFRGFLRSTSLPLKATIYSEWHDDRLMPWLHFVPFDNTFQDLYPILEYFADGDGGQGDHAARLIAERGRDWAEQVLRREDMKLYVWRLLLEWARICDRNRDILGFVGDLQP